MEFFCSSPTPMQPSRLLLSPFKSSLSRTLLPIPCFPLCFLLFFVLVLVEMYKSRLQELCQSKGWNLPKYDSTKEGLDHYPRFKGSVLVNGLTFETSNLSKTAKEAQNAAAHLAFNHFTTPRNSPMLSLRPTAGCSTGSDVLNGTSLVDGAVEHRNQEKPNNPQSNGITSSISQDIQTTEMLLGYKNRLQILAQKRDLGPPIYDCEQKGQPHCRRFKAIVTIGKQTFESPEFFKTLKEAEQAAAKAALTSLSAGDQEDDCGLFKNFLQEFVQREGFSLPQYKTITSGADHVPTFFSTVEIEGEIFSGKEAKTKKQAEIYAARVAWFSLKERETRGKNASHKILDDDKTGILHSTHRTSKLDVSGVPCNSQSSYSSEATPSNKKSSESSDIIYASLRDPFPVGPSCSDDEESSQATLSDCSDPSDLPSDLSTGKSSASLLGNRILVFPRSSNRKLPEGAVRLPISDNMWVAAKLDSVEDESKS